MSTRPVSSLAGLALLASRIACLIVLAAFVVFVVNQTSSASVHQQAELPGSSVSASGESSSAASSSSSSSEPQHQSTFHRTLDEVSSTLTSPFAGVVADSSSEWLIQLVRTGLALLVYGFGVALLVRFIRIRV